MSDLPKVAIFWDFENCSPPSNSCGLGYGIANNIGRIARLFGPVSTFRAYLDVSAQSPKSVALRSELQSSGVSIIDCPHNGKKDVVDKMILVDMLAFAVDHPTPATIILIAGDRDYAYAVSTLKLRKYQVILVVPSSPHIPPCLESQASLVIDWGTAVLRSRTEPANSTQPVRQHDFDLDATLVTKLLRELQDSPPDDPDTTLHSASRLRRVTARELLEPSRHSKNTASFDSTQEFTHNPVSPRKYTTTGLPIPKTPSRSRRASVSMGSTRARSTTIVAQCPPAVEQYTPPLSTAGRSSASDVSSLAKHSLSVPTSPDALELPLHDNRSPSPIIVRSPLEPAQSACDVLGVPGKLTIPSSHKLDYLASSFMMAMPPSGSQSVPNQQSRTTVNPTSPTAAPTKTLTETVTTVCRTPQMKDIGAPKEMERLTGLCLEIDEETCEQSIPRRTRSEGACSAADLAVPNSHSYITSHATHSLSNRNVGLCLTDTPASKLPTASSPAVGDGDNAAQFAAWSCASKTRDHPAPGSMSASSSSTSPSTPSAATESHERGESKRCQTWTMFKTLIHLLLAAQERGIARPARSIIAVDLVKSDSQVYQRAGVSRFRDYTALAEKAGVIELGGKEAGAWIALHPDWFGVDDITTTQFLSDRDSCPTFDSSKTTQGPLLTGSETPLIERAAIFQTPGPRSLSPESSQTSASPDFIPAQFQPLIDTLVRIRAEGSHHPRRSLVGQTLDKAIYSQAGVSGFREYVLRASEAQLVEFGGVGGDAWIRLHPELQF